MGDHFVLLVDRLLTEATLGAAFEDQNRTRQAIPLATDGAVEGKSSHNMDFGNRLYPRKVVECRICQDEDEDANMEVPCSCCGSLKYAHRRCVQRWCNEKGDTVCEICHQQFKPGYTAPPHVFKFRDIPMNLRENWEISRRNLNNPRFIAMVSTDRNFLDPEYDEYAASTARSLACCRSVAVFLMLLLILRHALPLLIGGLDDYSFPVSMVVLLSAAVVFPIYIVCTAVTAMQRQRRQQEFHVVSSNSSDEETALQQHQPHIIHVG